MILAHPNSRKEFSFESGLAIVAALRVKRKKDRVTPSVLPE